MKKKMLKAGLAGAALCFCAAGAARGEAILQVFNQSHNEIAARLPEIAEAGYTALWVPPPTKANGGMSVGYDLNDPFDIGNSDLRGTWSTRYGVEADLHNLIELCHRFGMRVYFDNVMNHRSYDVPGWDESTPTDVYPGMAPEDFHVRTTSDGFYRKWDNVRDWNDGWQVMFLGLSDLLDIAHETNEADSDGNHYNQNFGATEGSWHIKPRFVRHAYHHEDTWRLFDRMPYPGKKNDDYRVGDGALQNFDENNGVNLYTGFENNRWNPEDQTTAALIAQYHDWFVENDALNGVSTTLIENFPNFYAEEVGDYLNRAVRWLVDRTHVDGLRLDAVKHVPYYFYGDDWSDGKNRSNYGYLGQAQWQFNMTRGFKDWDNHRNSVFNIDDPRDDLMAFGEHLGNPPPQGPYVDTGMRLVDDRLRNELNWRFSANQLEGFDGEYAGTELGPDRGVMHAQSHDNDFVDRKPLHHAMYFMRRGLGLVYSDGNCHAETLTGSGGAFPRWAQTDFLGQWHQKQIPTLLHAHENFARYGQYPKWSQGNYVAFQRGGGIDENFNHWETMLFQLNSSWDGWEPAHTAGDFGDVYLYDYASDMYMPHKDDGMWSEAPYAWGGELCSNVKLPPNSYAIWSWKNPDPSGVYPTPYPECFVNSDDRILAPDSRVITILEDGKVVEPVWVTRKDGVDGDPDFNPYEVADTNATDYSYTIAIPRVTKGTDVTLAVKADGSAGNLRLRLDGGMDFGNGISNEHNHDWRDSAPGMSDDFWLGFENADGWFKHRIWSEKFAAGLIDNCHIGSPGARTYEVTVGETPDAGSDNPSDGPEPIDPPGWAYHNPAAKTSELPVPTGQEIVETKTFSVRAAVEGTGDADGFWGWDDSQCSDFGARSGWFAAANLSSLWSGYDDKGDPISVSLTGFGGDQAFGLWAKPYDAENNPQATLTRGFAHPDGLSSAGVTVGTAWDNNYEGGLKGVEFTDENGNAVFGVQHKKVDGNGDVIYYYGPNGLWGTWSADYGTAAFDVALAKTATGWQATGTTRSGEPAPTVDIATGAKVAGFKAYMQGVPANGDETQPYYKSEDARQLYFDDLHYTATVTNEATERREVPQFQLTDQTAHVWLKTSGEDDLVAFLYYTTDGESWPEGAGGVPSNLKTKALEGTWVENADGGSWWRFDIPRGDIPNGTKLRYKLSCARNAGKGFDKGEDFVVWPGKPEDIEDKKKMLTLWTIPGLDFTTQQYHLHNDYDLSTWTTGFKDGYHLATARVFLRRTDGASIVNTFRQTFYLDLHVPNGEILYPARDGEEVGGGEYGMVVRTDGTVDEVWYHIEDVNPQNDGPGNGTTTNGIEWAKADRVQAWTKEMAQDTELPRVWRFTYKGIAAKGSNATIRVRLREVSSVPADEWSKEGIETGAALEALHVKELTRTVQAWGDDYYMYFEWPTQANEMVEAGWQIRLKVSPNFAGGMQASDAKNLFTMTLTHVATTEDGPATNVTTVAGATGAQFDWNWPNDSSLLFTMPNVFTGNEADKHDLKVTGTWSHDGKTETVVATNIVRTKGPLLPKCIVTTPPETDSDGAAWTITMDDSTEAREGPRELRETPIVVLTDSAATDLSLRFVAPEGYGEGLAATAAEAAACAALAASNAAAAARSEGAATNAVPWPEAGALRMTGFSDSGTAMTWSFAWQVTNAGTYRFAADVTVDNSGNQFSAATNGAFRTTHVRFRQKTKLASPDDLDWDDDGVPNEAEARQTALPINAAEQWVQDEVFAHKGSGEFDSSCPDTDGDGLPDGLELGYRTPARDTDGVVCTDAAADTNGDGWPNFVGDLDPPFYNTLPDNHGRFDPGVVSDAGSGADRTKMVAGSVTDPRNPDSDNDGIPDGVEDANRNGWVDGDGQPFPTDWDPYRGFSWADGKMKGETWEETSPCVWDSDSDGLCDGYGEDSDFNGWTDMALLYGPDDDPVPLTPADYEALGIGVDVYSRANSSSTRNPKPYTSRAIDYGKLFAAYNVTNPTPGASGSNQTNGWPRLVILETDPLCADTDHDGLPDGWEASYSLDPLNNGVYDFRTGEWTTNATHGAAGNPDDDVYDNATEYARGSNPRSKDSDGSGGGAGQGQFSVGPGDKLGKVNDTEYFTEFTWWTLDDLLALDDYNQGGNSSDIYRCGDGFDSSRDMVAFYFRDGGAEDGKLYFRVDFDDLRPFAEESALNVYVAINYGQYGSGVTALPDDVNCDTEMGWNALVGVYDSQNGCVYRQTDGEAYESLAGFRGAYFDRELDSVMWSVDRAALLGPDWVGGTDSLKFQVYTTRDFTSDSGGSGDKGGLNDFTDVFGNYSDDYLCSDYWNDYNYIAANGVYRVCVAKNADGSDWRIWNHLNRHAKLAMVAHGNQAIEAGSTIQALVNDGNGAGYDRLVKIHNIYTNCPLNLHITPTLAIALQWAEAGTDKTWHSGPSFNASIRQGVASGALALTGSTYSDHVMKYFPDDFNKDNLAAARAVLNEVYGEGTNDVVSTKVLWSSERVADVATLKKMRNLGYEATVVDQTPHLLDWFGRQTSLGSDAYKIQRYWLKGDGSEEEAKAFVLSSAADNFRYANTDGGLSEDLRHLFLRRARSGEAAISSVFYRWEDFANRDNADGYDRSLRWIANHPWIQVVTFDEALADETLANSMFYHDLHATNGMAMQDWVHHACNGNYDNWFYGSPRHESLSEKKFEVREGEYIETPWGTRTNGILSGAWGAVKGIRNAQVKALAEATIFASAFETAFHEENNNNLSRWSYGEYMYPATEWMGLMSMAWRAQSRTRLAAMYAAVDEWTRSSAGVEALSADLDLDGEPEWILRNNTVMAVFEAEGGLMVGAWYKDGPNVWQMVGNCAAQPETGYETQSAGTDSTRGTAMKDIGVGNGNMVATNYAVTSGTNALTFKSGSVTKTVSLAKASSTAFDIAYSASGKALRVRNGLSPDLATLMVGGQARLGEEAEGNTLTLTTTSGGTAVSATVRVTAGAIDGGATDQPQDSGWNTINLRNAPQVRQVDVVGTGSVKYSIEFAKEQTRHNPPAMKVTPAGEQTFPVGRTGSFRVTATDWQGDALPVEAELPTMASVYSGVPTWDPGSGVLLWTVGAIDPTGMRMADWRTNATFRAKDDWGTAEETVDIVVPWDADGTDPRIGDDWEYLAKKNAQQRQLESDYDGDPDGDADGDGFSNYSEWVAGTDPANDEEYIAWERQVVHVDEATGKTLVSLEFRSVEGGLYDIEQTDAHGLAAGGTNWQWQASVTGAVGQATTWWTGERPDGESRMYRIRVQFKPR